MTRTRMYSPLLLGLTWLLIAAPVDAIQAPNMLTVHRPTEQVLRLPARLRVQEVELPQALRELHARSGAPLLFSPSIVPPVTVTCACGDLDVEGALRVMLRDTDLDFTERAGQVVITTRRGPGRRETTASIPQPPMPLALDLIGASFIAPPVPVEGTIVGRVVERGTQRPLQGTHVSIEGTSLGAITDAAGNFVIDNVPAGSVTVIAQLIGYATASREVAVSSNSTIRVDLALSESAVNLDAIVVTATGEARAREMATSLSRITARDIEGLAPRHAQDLLSGKTPGVVVLQNSGQPGAAGTIVLRGNKSISLGNDPIIYIDGIRIHGGAVSGNMSTSQRTSALNDINPADIERIEIVKGAAATTLYGTEASAGVIQIFTRRGQSGAARWTAEVGSGLNSLGHVGPKTDNPTGLWLNRCRGSGLVDYRGIEFEDPTCPASGSWLQRGLIQKYNLSVSGGTDLANYFLSANFNDEEGTIAGGGGTAHGGIRANFGVRPVESLDVAFNTSVTRRSTRWIPEGQGNDAFLVNVTRGASGNYRTGTGCSTPDIICVMNKENLKSENTTDSYKIVAGITLRHRTTERLRNRVTLGFDRTSAEDRMFHPYGHMRVPLGKLETRDLTRTQLSADYVGTLSWSLRGVGSELSWGAQAFSDASRTLATRAQDFPGPGMPTIVDAARREVVGNFEEHVINAGVFINESLAWRDRLFVQAGLRVDGNSAFGKSYGLQPYPKFGAAYVLSEHAFWPTDIINTFKLRGAAGESGRAPGAFDALRTWTSVAGDEGKPGYTPAQIGNADLGPERSREYEAGFEASAFADRVAIDATYYHQTTRDALVPVIFPPSQGFSNTQLKNVGLLRNSGTELSVNVLLVRNDALRWNVRVDHSTVKSVALDLGGQDVTVDASSRTLIREGYPVPSYFGDRITNPGEFADPIIEKDAYLGSPYPTRTIGLSTGIELGGSLTLEALGEFHLGGFLLNNIAYQNARIGTWPGCFEVQQKEIRLLAGDSGAFDDVTALERARCALNTSEIAHFRESWIEKSDYFRLRNISATVQLPERLRPPGARAASLQIAARNLLTITDFNGPDPEVNDNPGSLSRRDYYNVPTYRTLLINLKVHY